MCKGGCPDLMKCRKLNIVIHTYRVTKVGDYLSCCMQLKTYKQAFFMYTVINTLQEAGLQRRKCLGYWGFKSHCCKVLWNRDHSLRSPHCLISLV